MAPGHAQEVQQNFFKKVEVKEDQTLARQVYDQAHDKLQTMVVAIATPLVQVDKKEYACLARNIFFEAGNEPEEGKVAVGIVTLNRVSDGRFSNSVCGVVDQKVTRDIATQGIVEKRNFFGTTKETQTVWHKLTICQFSWRCMFVKNPNSQDERWVESQRIARELLEDSGNYYDYRVKYGEALYFHATGVKPTWARQKTVVEKIGGHIFYSDPTKNVFSNIR